MFAGLSSLRKAEKKEPSKQDKALQDYLNRQYGDGTAAEDTQRKKKKKKHKQQGHSAIAIVDSDISALPPVTEAAAKPLKPDFAVEAANSEDDEPVIANPEEAEALRLQIEKSKNFYAEGKDGSGWVAAAAVNGQHRRQRHDSPDDGVQDLSPPRRQRHDSPGLSPPRRSAAAAAGDRRAGSPDLSPPRRGRQRHDSPDLSPPRRSTAAAGAAGGRRAGSQDLSPPRRQRHDSPDLSPPRRSTAAATASGRRGSPDLSPPRRGPQRHDSPDLSPPRRSTAAAAGHAAVAGKRRHDTDRSPPRRNRQRHDSPPDTSTARRRRDDSPLDESHPRRGRPVSPAAAADRGRAQDSRQQCMTDGTAAGLVSSKELAEEAARLRAQAEERKRCAAGAGEATVYRDKETGAVISAEEYAAQVAKSRRKKEPPEEVHVAWKGGLAQQRAAVEAAQRAAQEAAKDFGRSFDADADVELRSRNRWGDPMAGKLSRQPVGDGFDLPPPVITEANRAMMEASGFNVPQEVPQHSWLRRKVPAPVNRYSLKPGRHWDGVDRSNGFEKEMFKLLNQRNAQELEARMWAQEDM